MGVTFDPWTVDAKELGLVVDESLRALVNCWVRGQVPTRDEANDVTRARSCLAYLVTRAHVHSREGEADKALAAVVKAAEALVAAEGLYEAKGGRQREVDALRQALAALGDWPKAGYDTPMFGGGA